MIATVEEHPLLQQGTDLVFYLAEPAIIEPGRGDLVLRVPDISPRNYYLAFVSPDEALTEAGVIINNLPGYGDASLASEFTLSYIATQSARFEAGTPVLLAECRRINRHSLRSAMMGASSHGLSHK